MADSINKQIAEKLEHLTLKQKKAVLGVVKAFSEEDEFDKEMNKRIEEYGSGQVKTFTFEESAARAVKAYRSSKSK